MQSWVFDNFFGSSVIWRLKLSDMTELHLFIIHLMLNFTVPVIILQYTCFFMWLQSWTNSHLTRQASATMLKGIQSLSSDTDHCLGACQPQHLWSVCFYVSEIFYKVTHCITVRAARAKYCITLCIGDTHFSLQCCYVCVYFCAFYLILEYMRTSWIVSVMAG